MRSGEPPEGRDPPDVHIVGRVRTVREVDPLAIGRPDWIVVVQSGVEEGPLAGDRRCNNSAGIAAGTVGDEQRITRALLK